jgi:hypothetical protein
MDKSSLQASFNFPSANGYQKRIERSAHILSKDDVTVLVLKLIAIPLLECT